MKQLFCLTALCIILLGCSNPQSLGSVSSVNGETQVVLQSEFDNYEIIQEFDLDNCDGKADATRTEHRSSSIDVTVSTELAAKIGASAQVISADVQTAVGTALSIGGERGTSIELTAPPNTHMFFQLAWVGKSRIGVVQNVSGSDIPVAFQSFSPDNVRIKSQYDISCRTTPTPDAQPVVTQNPVVPANQPTSTATLSICPLIVIEGSIEGLPITQTKTWAELSQQGTTREPKSANINHICSRDSDNRVQAWVGYWSGDRSYLDFRKTMTSEEALILVRQNPQQPIIIVPWGE